MMPSAAASTEFEHRPRATAAAPPVLVGRAIESLALEQALATARTGASAVLVLRGEPGVGKTALLEYARAAAADFDLVWANGAEAESGLPFAGLHQICLPFLAALEHLPAPQRVALESAFGLAAAPAPSRFLVGLGALTLLAEAAAERPLLLVVDDAQWLDVESAETLAFIARRLHADGIAALFSFTDADSCDLRAFGRMQEIRVAGLEPPEAHELLDRTAATPVSVAVGARLARETVGNPLALTELVAQLSPAQLAGDERLPEALPFGGRLEATYLARVRALPLETQRFLLLVAAEPRADAALLTGAAELLGIAPEAAAAAEPGALLRVGREVRFRHSLIRRAAYEGASVADRQRTHAVLADLAAEAGEPHHRAWHLAAATLLPNEDVAAELARTAALARERGGHSAATAHLERAADLSPHPEQHRVRLLEAAESALAGGDLPKLSSLVERARSHSFDGLNRARLRRLEGEIAFHSGHLAEAATALAEAAQAYGSSDSQRSREAQLRSLHIAILVSGIDDSGIVARAAKAARSAIPSGSAAPTTADILLEGLAVLYGEGHARAVPILRRAILAAHDDDDPTTVGIAVLAAGETWDHEGARRLAERHVALCRQRGELHGLPLALVQLANFVEVRDGHLGTADALIAEAREIANAIGASPLPRGIDIPAAAWRGDADLAYALAADKQEAHLKAGLPPGPGSLTQRNLAVLEIGRGHYTEALALARDASSGASAFPAMIALPELVEAAARSGQLELAALAANRLAEMTRPSGTDYALGVEARSYALLETGERAEVLYREAIERLQRTSAAIDLARAHLVFGEWLRREPRRSEARDELRTALGLFDSMSVDGFVERARRELGATGEHIRKRTNENRDDLTPQEAQIARLVSEGASNPDIAAQLFLSRRTVEYHLSKVFRKLQVSSRTQLTRALVQESATGLHVSVASMSTA